MASKRAKRVTTTRITTSPGAADLAEARRVDAKVCALVKRRRRDDAQLAVLLLDIQTRGLHHLLEFSDLATYAMDRGVADSRRKVRDLLAVLARVAPLPAHRAALLAGEIDWTKVRTSATVATPETDTHWMQKARTLTSRELEAAVSEARGRVPQVKWSLSLPREREALRERTFADVRSALGRTVTDGEVLEILCRTWLERSTPVDAGSAARTTIVVHTDDHGGRPTMESAAGEVEISHANLERALCGGAVVDLRDPKVKLRSTIPAKIARFVHARDKGVCRIRGCGRPGVPHVELIAGRKLVVDDPARVLLLCAVHHMDRHEGRLRILRSARTLRFCLRDGTRAPAQATAEADLLPAESKREERKERKKKDRKKEGKKEGKKTKKRKERHKKHGSTRGDPSRRSTGPNAAPGRRAVIAEPREVTAARARAPA